MDVEQSYLEAQRIVLEYMNFVATYNKRLFFSAYPVILKSPRYFLKTTVDYFKTLRSDIPEELPSEIKEAVASAYIKSDLKNPENDQFIEAIHSPLPNFAIAIVIKSRLPEVNFHSLLLIHESRKTDYPLIRDKKFLGSCAIMAIALWQRSDLKITEDITLRLPYEHLDMPGVWGGVIGLALPFSLFIVFIHLKKQKTHKDILWFFNAGKIIEDGQISQQTNK
ncbi:MULTISPECIES: hypothetical protein [unclassified Pseudomonas]|uniref:Uncharacterized protein n=1 Tax=Pseudomonas sp. Hg7Tf TaxID=3236988 RepID=A0AB39I3B3_9PSED|nr:MULTISPECIES: hypothetical protein [unclassified Pseudomonas]KJK05769.1 hypothetical protein UB47_19720 [Pseudomonas sp. 5]MDH2558826.1 hypothetical protein [Pseudomonas sp. Hg5Tf]